MILKGYFDGGNQADSKRYKTVTIGAVFSRPAELKPFEQEWRSILKRHGAASLHTKGAVALRREFLGWGKSERDALLRDCVDLVARSIIKPDGNRSVEPRIVPCVVTVVLTDFKRVQKEIPEGPQDATEVLATQSFYRMVQFSRLIKAHFLHLNYDQNEPFRGHIQDRLNNSKYKRDLKARGFDIDRQVVRIADADSRTTPALQVADLLAYCYGRTDSIHFKWQEQLLTIECVKEVLDYSELSKPSLDVARLSREIWKFPRRKPTL
jgi:hypothetical protein